MQKAVSSHQPLGPWWLVEIFKRGALFLLEVTGTLFVARSLYPLGAKVDILLALLGSVLLAVGCIMEYLVWIKTVQFLSPRLNNLADENVRLRSERDKLGSMLLSLAPQSALKASSPSAHTEE
jgi:hypothetical protein